MFGKRKKTIFNKVTVLQVIAQVTVCIWGKNRNNFKKNQILLLRLDAFWDMALAVFVEKKLNVTI